MAMGCLLLCWRAGVVASVAAAAVAGGGGILALVHRNEEMRSPHKKGVLPRWATRHPKLKTHLEDGGSVLPDVVRHGPSGGEHLEHVLAVDVHPGDSVVLSLRTTARMAFRRRDRKQEGEKTRNEPTRDVHRKKQYRTTDTSPAKMEKARRAARAELWLKQPLA